MKCEYITIEEIPKETRGCKIPNETMKEVKRFLKTSNQAIKFEYDSKAERDCAYNCLYAKYVRRSDKPSPIEMKREGLTMYVRKTLEYLEETIEERMIFS